MRPKIEISEEKLVKVLRQHQGSLQDAARALNISPSTLSTRLRELGYQRVIRWEKSIA